MCWSPGEIRPSHAEAHLRTMAALHASRPTSRACQGGHVYEWLDSHGPGVVTRRSGRSRERGEKFNDTAAREA